ncbi:MAG: hypothetical protein H6721_24685 [Sandaracinus sp.]|nr:hypothetical protein [Sandaracinus sp.]MCB9618973.1 hypothetical protein [Sandaracinus sp.]MCB9623619.1 hypothetical protein [Sandaracinus sp.]MCB9635330.1 hypothetical protein [Sandaracinus sp.]
MIGPIRFACAAALLVGCIRGEHRPAHDVRTLVERQLGCGDVQVAFAPRSPYRDDPLTDDRIDVVAWGCGQVARVRCTPSDPRGGWCEADTTYELPESESLAVVKVLGRYARREGVAQRERIVVDGAELVRPARYEAVAIPVRAGHSRWTLDSRPVTEREHHYTTTSRRRVGNREYETTYYHTRVVRELAVGCEIAFALDAYPGATYRIELDYHGPDRCDVRCAREVATPAGIRLAACEGFGS